MMRPLGAQPEDCLEYLDAKSSGAYDWTDLVWVEHCDRIKRLQRISAELPVNQQPQFYDGTVLARDLPGSINIDVPILRVVFPDRSFFDTNQSSVKASAIVVARIIAESLGKEPPDVVMFVAGHADARASRRYNQVLSIDRANALAEVVLGLGTGDASVWRVGFGEDLPLVAGGERGQLRMIATGEIEFLFSARPEALAVWMSRAQTSELCQGRTRREIDACKRSLNLTRPYEVVEIVSKPRQRDPVPVSAGGGKNTRISQGGGDEASVTSGRKGCDAAVARAENFAGFVSRQSKLVRITNRGLMSFPEHRKIRQS